MYCITDFGAKRDATCTKSIQAAIDAAAANGGGVVIIPSGVYVSGTLWLKSNVELHLEPGAVLKASSDMNEYNDEDAYPQNYGVPIEKWRAKHFIIALECDNVSITGSGIIDGSGDSFFGTDRTYPYPYSWEGGYVTSKDEELLRPGQCVCFIESTNVKVTDVTLTNTPSWGFFFHGCEYVQVRGIKISNPFECVNTDGLDIDCCRFVTVSDCIISTGDDAIAIRCDSLKLKNPKPCENITITNCVLASNSSVFRIGVGTGNIRHVRVSNLAISKAGTIISYFTSWEGEGKAMIEDISFSDITAHNALRAVNCDLKNGSVKNATMKNMSISAKGGIYVLQKEASLISDILFKNVDLRVCEKQLAEEKYLVNVSGASNVTLDTVKISAKKEDWLEVFHSENNVGLSVKNSDF